MWAVGRECGTVFLLNNDNVDCAAQSRRAWKVSKHPGDGCEGWRPYFIEFHVLETDPLRLRTYCIVSW